MGRLSNAEKASRKKRGWKHDTETKKTRHRFADTKYRSKVQFLYGKLEELVDNNSTKIKKVIILLNYKVHNISCVLIKSKPELDYGYFHMETCSRK